MVGKFVILIYDADFSYPLKAGEFLDLRTLEHECESKGVQFWHNKSHLVVALENIKFRIYANGRIGWCWLKCEKDSFYLRDSLIPFFWKNFACKCVERRVVKNE